MPIPPEYREIVPEREYFAEITLSLMESAPVLDYLKRSKPELFIALRGLIDKGRRTGRRNGQFLILGSASINLLKQSFESLAERIAYVEMSPVTAIEISAAHSSIDTLWLRGGFPDSLLSPSDSISVEWRQAL